MRAQDFLIAILIGALFIVIPLSFISSSYNDMGVVMDSEVNDSFGEFMTIAQDANVQMTNMSADIAAKSPGGSEVNANTDQTYEDNLIKASTRVLGLIPQSYGIIRGAMSAIARRAGINPIFMTVGFSIIVIIVSFMFISALLRQNV